MTALHEAVTLPLLFLAVVGIAAFRPAGDAVFVPPSLAALVVAMLLVALIVRSGALAPERLLHQGRPMLANLNGMSVLLTMFAATAQIITLVVPERGLPALLVWVVLLSLVFQAFAMGPDRTRLVRGLLVTFGAAFVLKFIVLAMLSQPADGGVSRALQLLFEGVTLGTVTQRPAQPLEGYLAFAAILLYVFGVAALPGASWQMVRTHRKELTA